MHGEHKSPHQISLHKILGRYFLSEYGFLELSCHFFIRGEPPNKNAAPLPIVVIGLKSAGTLPRCTKRNWNPALRRASSGKEPTSSLEVPIQLIGLSSIQVLYFIWHKSVKDLDRFPSSY